MSRSTAPTDKEETLERTLDVVSYREEAYRDACMQYADAESSYRIAKSKEYLLAEGTEKAREATAIVKVERLLEAKEKAKAVKEFTEQYLRDAQLSVSARQSLLNADLRTNKAFA